MWKLQKKNLKFILLLNQGASIPIDRMKYLVINIIAIIGILNYFIGHLFVYITPLRKLHYNWNRHMHKFWPMGILHTICMHNSTFYLLWPQVVLAFPAPSLPTCRIGVSKLHQGQGNGNVRLPSTVRICLLIIAHKKYFIISKKFIISIFIFSISKIETWRINWS